MLITEDSSPYIDTSFLSSTSSILFDSWESVAENDTRKDLKNLLNSIPHFDCVKPEDFNNYSTFSSIESEPSCSTPLETNNIKSKDLIKLSNQKLDELIEILIAKKQASSFQCMCKSIDSISSLSSIESQDEKPFISETMRHRSNELRKATFLLDQKRDELYKNDTLIRQNWEKLKAKIEDYKTNNVVVNEPESIRHYYNHQYEQMDTMMPNYEHDYLNRNKEIRFIYGRDKSVEDTVLNSSLKSNKDHTRSLSHNNNRVKFNDTIEFYDPSQQNRAIYSLEEFAHLKSKQSQGNIISWGDLATRTQNEGKIIPIEIETEQQKSPMVELCYEDKINMPRQRSEPFYSYIEPKLIKTTPLTRNINIYDAKSQRKQNSDLNSYYDAITQVNQSKYPINNDNEYTTIDKLMNNSIGSNPDDSFESTANKKLSMIHKYRTHSSDNYLDFKPMRFDRTCNTVKPVAFTISSQPQPKPYRSRGIVKIKTSQNLNTQQEQQKQLKTENKPIVRTIESKSPLISVPVQREISFYKNPTSSQIPREIPIEHIYQREEEKQQEKQQEPQLQDIDEDENDYMTTESEKQTTTDQDSYIKTSNSINSTKLLNSNEINNDLNESVSEYLNKSKVFNQSGKVLDELHNQQRSSSKVHRRSSRIGDENNDKELNSIFKRIYNRHRYSLTNENQKPGIRRVSNTSNLSSF